MGIMILLTTERGEILEDARDPTNHLHRVLPGDGESGYLLLHFIDWYGDTIFNRLQMPQFMVEWAKLERVAQAEGAGDLHSKVASMAERCAAEVHLYLKFQGD